MTHTGNGTKSNHHLSQINSELVWIQTQTYVKICQRV